MNTRFYNLTENKRKGQQACLGSNALQLACHVVQGSSIFTGTKSVLCKCSSLVLPSMLSFSIAQEMSEGNLCLLLMISQSTNIHNDTLQALLSLPVYDQMP